MKIIEMECPTCGAPLRYNEVEEVYVCEYCNNTFTIEDDIEEKKSYKSLIARICIPATLVATGAMIVSLGVKSLINTNNTVKSDEPKVSYQVEVDKPVEEEIDIRDNDILYLSSNIDARAEYLYNSFKDYGIINRNTNEYYTKEEIIDYINFINGNSSINEDEALEKFDNSFLNFLLDTLNSKYYISAANYDIVTPYNIHLAEAITNDKNNRLYPLLLHLDGLHRSILNSNDDYKRQTLKEEFKSIINGLIVGDYEYNYEHYSIDDFNNEDNCFAQALLEQYVLDILPFAPDYELANYFNSGDGNSYMNTIENNLKNAYISEKLSL